MNVLNVFEKEMVHKMQEDNMDAIKSEALRLAGDGTKQFQAVFDELAEVFTNCKDFESLPLQDAYIKLKGISLFLSSVCDSLVAEKFHNIISGRTN